VLKELELLYAPIEDDGSVEENRQLTDRIGTL
jgi:hypothetical protein